jgi:hypothetical protein
MFLVSEEASISASTKVTIVETKESKTCSETGFKSIKL